MEVWAAKEPPLGLDGHKGTSQECLCSFHKYIVHEIFPFIS